MTTFVLFTPALSSQPSGQLSGPDSVLTSNAVLTPYSGDTNILGVNANLGNNPAINFGNFEFTATLDGNSYSIIVTWSIYAQRYYVNILRTDNTLVLSIPLIGSPNDYDISMTAGYFTSTLVYREYSRQFEITP